MECVILVRVGARVLAMENEDDSLRVFPDFDEAVACAMDSMLCRAYPHQIVELDEL